MARAPTEDETPSLQQDRVIYGTSMGAANLQIRRSHTADIGGYHFGYADAEEDTRE